MGLTINHRLPKNTTQHCKKTPIDDEDIEIIGTRPAISRNFSPIFRNI